MHEIIDGDLAVPNSFERFSRMGEFLRAVLAYQAQLVETKRALERRSVRHPPTRFVEEVVRRHHLLGLSHRFRVDGHKDAHRVTVVVRVEAGSRQRMDLNGASRYWLGSKSLHAVLVQRGI